MPKKPKHKKTESTFLPVPIETEPEDTDIDAEIGPLPAEPNPADPDHVVMAESSDDADTTSVLPSDRADAASVQTAETRSGRFLPDLVFSRNNRLLWGIGLALLLIVLTILVIAINSWLLRDESRTALSSDRRVLVYTEQTATTQTANPAETQTAPTSQENSSLTTEETATPKVAGSAATALIAGDAAALPASALARVGRLEIGMDESIDFINPLYATHDGETDMASLIFEPLFRLSRDAGPVGVLAESWQYAADSHQLLIVLQRDHLFRDGRTVQVDDVVFTYQCLLSSSYDGPLKGRFQPIQSVTAGAEANTIVFQMADWVTEPDYSLFTVGILKSDYYSCPADRVFEIGEKKQSPEGSGAFELIEVTAYSATLQLRPGYAGNVSTLHFQVVASEDKYDLLLAGELDIIRNDWDARMQTRIQNLPGYNFYPMSSRVGSYLLISTHPGSSQVLQAPEQRTAVLHLASGRPITPEQQTLLQALQQPVILNYFLGVDEQAAKDNLNFSHNLGRPLEKLGLTVEYVGLDWPELAGMAAAGTFDLLVLPATSNNRLPEGTILLDTQDAMADPQANACVAAWQDMVMACSARLQLMTINPDGFPLSASTASWTERLENIRIVMPEMGN